MTLAFDTDEATNVFRAINRLRRHKSNGLVLGAVLLFVLVGIAGGYFTPYDSTKQNLAAVLQSPSQGHWFGTDQLGRDVLSRVIEGTRLSLVVGTVAIGIAGVIGGSLGFISGFGGGILDEVLMRVVDTLMAFPGLLLALIAVTVLGPGLTTAAIAVGLTQIPVVARLARSTILSERERLYVEAAGALGMGKVRLLFLHLIPNCLGPLIAQLSLMLADAILIIAGLGFLGLGAQPPTPEWGIMLSESRLYMWQSPYLAVFPGLAISLFVLTFNLLGDSLRTALDKRE